MQKSLEKDSDYNQYDMDGDGVVTDEELEHAKDIKKTETELRKNVAQLRMARYTLIFMGCYAAFLASPWCSARWPTSTRSASPPPKRTARSSTGRAAARR